LPHQALFRCVFFFFFFLKLEKFIRQRSGQIQA